MISPATSTHSRRNSTISRSLNQDLERNNIDEDEEEEDEDEIIDRAAGELFNERRARNDDP